jgi:hypothetical protein
MSSSRRLGEKRTRLDAVVQVSAGGGGGAGPRRRADVHRAGPARSPSTSCCAGLIVVSGNDAAVALAEHAAGSTEAFVERMNAEARRLGMTNTRFANPTGFSDPQQYSTAEDLARLAQRLLSDFPQYAQLFAARVHLQQHHASEPQPSAVERQQRRRHEDRTHGRRRLVGRRDGLPDAGQRGDAPSAAAWSPSCSAPPATRRERRKRCGCSISAMPRLIPCGSTGRATSWCVPRSGRETAASVPIGVERDVYVTVPATPCGRWGKGGFQSALERPDPLVAPLRRVKRGRWTAEGHRRRRQRRRRACGRPRERRRGRAGRAARTMQCDFGGGGGTDGMAPGNVLPER